MPARRYRTQSEKTALDRLLTRVAHSRLGGLLFITVFPAIDKRVMPLTKGRLSTGLGQTVLLLHARGARSGEPRVTPLLFTPRGEDFILVASKAGAKRHPAWYHNLSAHPQVEVEVDGERIPVTAREAEGAERAELWRLVNDNYLGYEVYQQRAGARQIPVMVLSPR
ncbi:MAG: nitroreductase family deazaflavin-dependent oxidoreductase [Actinomycetota bacterium]|nr:nitroreductase family deazaflavin-dependent oxidoreductase [Actinomycetota bacterium]